MKEALRGQGAMRRLAVAIAWMFVAAVSLSAQGAHHSIRINGWGGFGFDYLNTESGSQGGPFLGASSRDLNGDFGIEGHGFLYDPRFLNYTLSAAWNGTDISVDQGSARTGGLTYNGNVSLLPLRPYPFAIYFSRSRSSTSGALVPPYTTLNNLVGIRGDLKYRRFALISYNFGTGSTENDLAAGQVFENRQRFANVAATRNLRGWALRFGEDYLWTSSTFSNFRQQSNTLSFDAARSFRERIRVDLGANYSKFDFRDQQGGSKSDSSVAVVNGSVSWKHTEKLDSYYNAFLTRNAVNTLRLLISPVSPPLPFNPLSTQTTTEAFSAGAGYRVTPEFSLSPSFGYSHNSVPEATIATLPPSAQNSFTTSALNVGLSANYLHKFGKLDYRFTGSLGWQRFVVVSGATDSGLGYSLENGLSGGNLRTVRFSGSYRYGHRSNPVFFNLVTSTDHHVTLKADTARLRGLLLQGMVEIGRTDLDLVGSNLHLDLRNYMLSAVWKQLNVYASRGVSSSDELFFGPGSIFQTAGASNRDANQNFALPPPLLNSPVFSDVVQDRIGATWRPQPRLQLEGRYTDSHFLFTTSRSTENLYRQFDVAVQYQFGRFTMYGGYARTHSAADIFKLNGNRVLFRVRFPFHVL